VNLKVSVIGTGYVGLVTGACLADLGNEVLCLDIDAAKVAALQDGHVPIYEPGLEETVRRNVAAGRLQFSTDPAAAAEHGDYHFIAVGTPPNEDGSADVRYVHAAATNIARSMNRYAVIIDKSTVPVGTGAQVHDIVSSILAERGVDFGFSVVSNPEFLKEGAALEDFMNPDRVVIGAEDERSIEAMTVLYKPLLTDANRLQVTSVRSAELIKYAANAMLATRISFMNELALLAEQVGANIDDVRRGIGSDTRIGSAFLNAGAGYGGSCFPKDVQALIRTSRESGLAGLKILEAVEAVNNAQKSRLTEKVLAQFGDITGMVFALWGLAFKPNTDDIREATSLQLIDDLTSRGASVVAYDPVAIDATKKVISNPLVSFAESSTAAVGGADALIIVTEWAEFRNADFDFLANSLSQRVVFDGRNLFAPADVAASGLVYHSIGRETVG
jgi:UDPglucose 6-dehydrogenase